MALELAPRVLLNLSVLLKVGSVDYVLYSSKAQEARPRNARHATSASIGLEVCFFSIGRLDEMGYPPPDPGNIGRHSLICLLVSSLRLRLST